MNQDDQYLRILSIFHYVVAGLAALFSCFPSIHLVVGILMASGVLEDAQDPFPIHLVGWLLILFASVLILCGWTFATCVFLTGRRLQARRKHLFCLVMACIECLFMPFGTVLGVFTIILLLKPAVKAQFGVPDEEAGSAAEAAGK